MTSTPNQTNWTNWISLLTCYSTGTSCFWGTETVHPLSLWTNGQMDGGGRGVGEGHWEKNKAFHATWWSVIFLSKKHSSAKSIPAKLYRACSSYQWQHAWGGTRNPAEKGRNVECLLLRFVKRVVQCTSSIHGSLNLGKSSGKYCTETQTKSNLFVHCSFVLCSTTC